MRERKGLRSRRSSRARDLRPRGPVFPRQAMKATARKPLPARRRRAAYLPPPAVDLPPCVPCRPRASHLSEPHKTPSCRLGLPLWSCCDNPCAPTSCDRGRSVETESLSSQRLPPSRTPASRTAPGPPLNGCRTLPCPRSTNGGTLPRWRPLEPSELRRYRRDRCLPTL